MGLEDYGIQQLDGREEYALMLEGLASAVREGSVGPVMTVADTPDGIMVGFYGADQPPVVGMALLANAQLYLTQMLAESEGEEDDADE